MDQDRSVRISPTEELQQAVMRQVASKLQDTPYVLKGGSALIFTRGLDRHSTDLDFDAGKKLNIKNRILEGLKAAGVQVNSIKAVKDTDTVQRYKVHYRDPTTEKDVLFKVETSFRQPPNPTDIEVVNGIRTYNIGKMFDEKMNAIVDRTEARDLYDLSHLVANYGHHLSQAQIERIDQFSADIDLLANRYGESLITDNVLIRFTDVDETVLKLREAVESQLYQRERLPEQPNPKVLAHQCKEFLKAGGTRTASGWKVEGDRFLIRDQNDVISIVAKDGRGKIFEYGGQKVVSDLNRHDLLKLGKLNSVNASLRQHLQQQRPHKRSPHRRGR